jgi:hypothetical protein
MAIVYGFWDRHRDMIDIPGNEPGVSTGAVTGGEWSRLGKGERSRQGRMEQARENGAS